MWNSWTVHYFNVNLTIVLLWPRVMSLLKEIKNNIAFLRLFFYRIASKTHIWDFFKSCWFFRPVAPKLLKCTEQWSTKYNNSVCIVFRGPLEQVSRTISGLGADFGNCFRYLTFFIIGILWKWELIYESVQFSFSFKRKSKSMS